MKPEQEQAIKLEMWKEIMRRETRYSPGQATIASPGIYPPSGISGVYYDPTAAAQMVQRAFDALYPKPATKRKR